MNYLVVAAHPDDEALGAGATIYKLTQMGHNVDACILSGMAEARGFRPVDKVLAEDMNSCMELLGIQKVYLGSFPNIKLNNVDHILLVQFIEKAIIESEPAVIITHHPGDTNNDHMHTSLACQEAIRLFQRKDDIKPLKEFLYMEVLSSTEWCVNSSLTPFQPNTYIEVGKEGIRKKIEGLARYRGVMRSYPHPRSSEAIEALAAYRGGQSGCNYAESFQCVLRRVEIKGTEGEL